jgi:putative phosphoribosyl transferase
MASIVAADRAPQLRSLNQAAALPALRNGANGQCLPGSNALGSHAMSAALHVFANRTAAGQELARAVKKHELAPPVLVLALPRGGVPVAFEVAQALQAPLDVMVVRKIGMPGQPELAIGAIASGKITVREPRFTFGLTDLDSVFDRLAQREQLELERRERAYRANRPPLSLRGKTVVLVDDGLATGATMVAAIRAAREAGAARVVVAAPVASEEAAERVKNEADDAILLQVPAFLYAIGEWYERFEQLEDDEVRSLLKRVSKE